MKKKVLSMLGALAMVLGFHAASYTQMQSANYRITTSVISGGGGPMASTSYRSKSLKAYQRRGENNQLKRDQYFLNTLPVCHHLFLTVAI